MQLKRWTCLVRRVGGEPLCVFEVVTDERSDALMRARTLCGLWYFRWRDDGGVIVNVSEFSDYRVRS